MASHWIVIPLILQVFLACALYVALVRVKKREAAQGNVDESRRSLHADAWPDSVLKINNCIRNQFEVPVLFYILILCQLSLGSIDLISHALAWLFVFSRYTHAWEHTGSNRIPRRRALFSIGVYIVLLLAIDTLVDVIGMG